MDRTGPRIATLTTATALLVALGGGAATAVDRPKEPSELTLINTGVGQVLADENGNPLYLRLADKPDRPGCTQKCATTWPAAVGFPTKAAGVIGETAQTPLNAANSDQPHVIYNTHPLYYYKNDRPNQPKGQNVDGFSLVSSDGKAVADRGGPATTPVPKPSAARTSSSTSKAKPPPAPKAPTTPKPAKPPAATTSAGASTADRVPGPRSTPAATATRAPVPNPVSPVAPVAPVAPARPTARGNASTGTGAGNGTSTSGTGTGAGTATTGTGTTGTATTGTGTTGTSTGNDTVPGPSVGALQVTPSGAARGGANHLTATTGSVRRTGAAELTLAIGATAAAALGTILVVRRHQRRATGDHH